MRLLLHYRLRCFFIQTYSVRGGDLCRQVKQTNSMTPLRRHVVDYTLISDTPAVDLVASHLPAMQLINQMLTRTRINYSLSPSDSLAFFVDQLLLEESEYPTVHYLSLGASCHSQFSIAVFSPALFDFYFQHQHMMHCAYSDSSRFTPLFASVPLLPLSPQSNAQPARQALM